MGDIFWRFDLIIIDDYAQEWETCCNLTLKTCVNDRHGPGR